MREARIVVFAPSLAGEIVWTQVEEPDADAVVYLNGYSYRRKDRPAEPGGVSDSLHVRAAFRLPDSFHPPVFTDFICFLWRSSGGLSEREV